MTEIVWAATLTVPAPEPAGLVARALMPAPGPDIMSSKGRILPATMTLPPCPDVELLLLMRPLVIRLMESANTWISPAEPVPELAFVEIPVSGTFKPAESHARSCPVLTITDPPCPDPDVLLLICPARSR